MTTCPLPIDWLDYLRGESSASMRRHLESCSTCQATVQSLVALDVQADRRTTFQFTGQRQRAEEPYPTAGGGSIMPMRGDIWWLDASDVDYRLPVLVLDIVEDLGHTAFDVAPMWTDIENALPGDLILSSSDSTLGAPWRVIFNEQLVVRKETLDSQLAKVTSFGAELLERALSGEVAPARTGVHPESDSDPRLEANGWMTELLLATAAYLDDIDEDDDFGVGDEFESGAANGDARIYSLAVAREKVKDAQAAYRLAAASPGSITTVVTVRSTSEASIRFYGLLSLDADEILQLEPVQVSGLDGSVEVITYSSQLNEPTSVVVTLEVGHRVALTTEPGISEFDVDKLEIRYP